MPVIDADAHVIETPETWSYMQDHEQAFRPQIFERAEDDGAPRRANQRREYWVIDERLLSKGSNVGQDVPADSRNMTSIQSRLDHMDEIGVDIAVIFPTLFLRPLTREHDVDFALARAYNRWMAGIWAEEKTRLRWVCVPPLLSLVDRAKVRDELAFAKEHGACGIFMRGAECERLPSHRYFYPFYEMAQELDLAITFHAGINSFAVHDAYAGDVAMFRAKFPVLGAFSMLAQEEIPARYPGLRWAFIEASAQWLPYMLGEARIRLQRKGRPVPDDILAENNFYITTQMTDDIPGLIAEVGDDHLLIGTDYGHKDTATDIHAMKRLAEVGDISPTSVEKILKTNPAVLYGLR
ncbi:MAG: amidohydrolase [Alphaproteobacteria bacterium]|nr:amidohydrolase [Alphaproteobacteria bacterium]